MVTRRSACLIAGAFALAPLARAVASPALPQPTDRALLTMTGRISVTNQGSAAVFDRTMLERMGMSTIETMTPWYASKVRFEGVPMTTLLKTVGADGQKILVTALNDYTTEIPTEDFARYGVILALKRDGQYMPVSDKGPLFIVYPYDAHPELRSQRFYGRSAWQVAKIEVR